MRSAPTLAQRMLFSLALLGLLGAPAAVHAEKKHHKLPPTLTEEEAEQVLKLVNEARAEHDLPALKLNDKLATAAQEWADHMKEKNKLSHGGMRGVGGQTCAKGYSTPGAVVKGWLHSKGHRAILLGKRYHQVGFGRAGTYWVADFR